VHGAKPLFFLDYFGTGKLSADVAADVVRGLARGCRANGCALIGGETAEMPGFYSQGEYDLVGFICGVVDRARIIDGRKIKPGNLILGLPSNGLHTNGFSLVRALFFERLRWRTDRRVPELGCTLGAELLRVHRSYLKVIDKLMNKITPKGLAHITGGGIPGNLSRILPDDCCAEIDTGSWERPMIFELIQKLGRVDDEEMYRTFNMGIGMMVVVGKSQADAVLRHFNRAGLDARVVGEIVKGEGDVKLR
jgi:phosphoribosylformylglycinamidine cyclo-ligase